MSFRNRANQQNGKNILDTGEDLGWQETLSVNLFIQKLERINRYVKNLIHSFDIMIDGMEKNQFLKFRMALLPSSGFQSVQYRMLEIRSTDIDNLCEKSSEKSSSIEENMQRLYWKLGANELKSGKKSYTLMQFEKKYQERLIKLATKMKSQNIWQKYMNLNDEDKQNPQLISLMKEYDVSVNVHWKLSHYKSAVKYLKRAEKELVATGGTNWQKYLPPKFQKLYFPKIIHKKRRKLGQMG